MKYSKPMQGDAADDIAWALLPISSSFILLPWNLTTSFILWDTHSCPNAGFRRFSDVFDTCFLTNLCRHSLMAFFTAFLAFFGFTKAGVAAGSWASWWQAWYGGLIAKGSWFAWFQSTGATWFVPWIFSFCWWQFEKWQELKFASSSCWTFKN